MSTIIHPVTVVSQAATVARADRLADLEMLVRAARRDVSMAEADYLAALEADGSGARVREARRDLLDARDLLERYGDLLDEGRV